ncbi:MAG: response regulator transcription factor [Clostridiales bacterium]|jgi:two-component system KDP operon response regulator KdpE|nr:response regulator transcription factor [Clostridiales bacterium]
MEIKTLVLIVEDESGISNFISAILSSNQYAVIQAKNGKQALTLLTSHCPDIVLLDLGLPDIDGIDVLKSIRAWNNIPVIIVSARGHEREKVSALDLGADDYITKPFGPSELLARIRTALRHNTTTTDKAEIFTVGGLSIDYIKRTVILDSKVVHLTPIEYKIIVLLSKNAGKVLTHDYIIKDIWGPYASENQALRVNMANIRRKIEFNPAEPRYILTEVGVGYRMVDE